MSRTLPFTAVHNGHAIPLTQVPQLRFEEFRSAIVEAAAAGQRVSTLFGHSPGVNTRVDLYAVLSDSSNETLNVAKSRLDSDNFPSLTPECPQVHLFEREIAEQYGVHPDGHPWFKPVRFHRSYRAEHDAWGRAGGEVPVMIGLTDFYRVEGDAIHEVAVGPVHAGVIEPGHFRFQCYGEQVFHLEISLGYQHRGAERTLAGGPDKRSIHTIETVAGDTSVGHGTAYCQLIEALSGCEVSDRANSLRSIALELERLANHTGDLGALAGDVGFLPTASYCGRLRGDFLNLTALLCGNRFGRCLLRPGGVRFDVDAARIQQSRERLDSALSDVSNAVELLWNSATVQARFEGTGTVTREVAVALGLVGPSARASGVERDIRQDFPTGMFRSATLPICTWKTGDVFARAYLRWLEIQQSAAFIRNQLATIPAGSICSASGPLRPDHLAVTLVEGWRGEICHCALTDAQGKFSRYKIVDPSFHNWMGLAMSLREQQIADFPLCNKSFNLSYCGHDL